MVRRKTQKHGLIVNGKKPTLYKLRERMIRYCYTLPETSKSYPSYRGKGIKVCDEWINDIAGFCKWAVDNGWKKGLTIDRINSNGDYEPSNCRFITRSENSIKARYENDQSGMNSSASKLTDEKVVAIKLLLKLGYPVRKIADFFDMGKSSITAINIGKTWKHIKEL